METIGDAYMIVSGVPIKTTTHAQPVARFAMDMFDEAANVLSPATGKPLQVHMQFVCFWRLCYWQSYIPHLNK